MVLNIWSQKTCDSPQTKNDSSRFLDIEFEYNTHIPTYYLFYVNYLRAIMAKDKRLNRKDQRKQVRQEKKARKQQNYVQRHQTLTKRRPNLPKPSDVPVPRKTAKRSWKEEDDEEIVSDEEVNLDKQEVVKTTTKNKRPPSKKLSEMNEDDLEVARLEKMLGVRENPSAWKKVAKGLMADGFDEDLIDFLRDSDRILKDTNVDDDDALDDETFSEAEGEEEDDEEEDFQTVPTKKRQIRGNTEESSDDNDKDVEEREDEDDSENGERVADEVDPMSHVPTTFLPSQNLYGDASVGFDDEDMRAIPQTHDTTLDLRVRGLLNRLSDENASKTFKDITALFDSNAPRTVLDSLGRMILLGTSPATSLLFASQVFAIETARPGFVGHLLETLVRNVESGKLVPPELQLLGYLCSLGACTADLPFQIFEKISTTETPDEEALVALVQTCGWKLRAADPTRFRNSVLAASVATESQRLDSHARSKIEYRTEEDKVKKWRKWVQRECKDGTSLPAPLGVAYQELLHAEKNGRWWILGASWNQASGAHAASSQQGGLSVGRSTKIMNPISTILANVEPKMIIIAEAQGMNTDLRKAIFCAIMSGDDYIHAFDSIIKLNLSDAGEREVVRIIMQCCFRSKRFNPFFALLGARLCSYQPRYKFSFQLAIWDEMKALDTAAGLGGGMIKTMTNLSNFAKFVASLIHQYALSLAVLKIVNFAKVASKEKLAFLRELFISLFTPIDDKDDAQSKREGDLAVARIFSRLRTSKDGSVIRDGILVFWLRTEPFMNLRKSDNPILHKRLNIARNVMEHFVKSEEEKVEDFI